MEQLHQLLGIEEGRDVLTRFTLPKLLPSPDWRAGAGFSLIELMIGIAILSILMTLGLPSFRQFLQNTQIRNAAETTMQGLNLARNEAVRRNTPVRFTLVTSLTSGCVASTTSLNWVVSQADPAGMCEVAPSATTAPQIIQKKSAAEGSPMVTATATGNSSVIFNGLGRATGTPISQIDFSNPAGGSCEHTAADGTMRCLRVMISIGGQTKMCDPKVSDTTDPRHCS